MTYNPEEDIKVSDLPEKTTNVVSDDKLLVIDSEDANILKQVDASKVKGSGGGSGYTKAETDALLNAKQDTLESGTNIKTINGQDILGAGNIVIQGGGTVTIDDTLSTTSENPVQNKVITNALNGKADTSAIPDVSNLATKTELQAKQDTLVSGTNIKTVNNQSLLGNGDITIQGGGKMPVSMDVTTSYLRYIFPQSVGGVSTLPRMWRVDYTAKTYRIDTPDNYKIYQGVGFINLTVDDLNVTTNPSEWTFGCIYDGKYYDDCLFYIDYQQASGFAGYKLVPTEVNSDGRVVLNRIEHGSVSSSYIADLTIFRTQIR